MTDALRIVTFAGEPVPEDGLTVHPPQGGEMTVWPDGGYAFTPAVGGISAGGQEAVTTYYSYVLEDIYGETITGTFALNPENEVPGAMRDFHAWSLPELIDGGDAAGILLAEPPGDFFQMSGTEDDRSAATVLGVIGLEPGFDDDLARLLIDSQNS
jgi:hypothetical protein